MRSRPLAQMLAIGSIASVAGVALALLIDWFPPQASTTAGDVDLLYDVLLIVSVPIFVVVMTVAIYSVVRFRARAGDQRDGLPIHGNARLELAWVTVPFLLVTGLAAYAWITLDDIEGRQPDAMNVQVIARQFAWSYEYERPGGGEPVATSDLVLPLGQPVEFDITTLDVIHSFWVPAFRLKQDAVPGITTRIRLTPDRLGTYDAVCAELCGIGHSTMRGEVRVVSEAEYRDWLAEQARPSPESPARAGSGPS